MSLQSDYAGGWGWHRVLGVPSEVHTFSPAVGMGREHSAGSFSGDFATFPQSLSWRLDLRTLSCSILCIYVASPQYADIWSKISLDVPVKVFLKCG